MRNSVNTDLMIGLEWEKLINRDTPHNDGISKTRIREIFARMERSAVKETNKPDEFFKLRKIPKPFPALAVRGKKQKSSIFRGVRRDPDNPDMWFAQIRAAHLHRRCATEAEAAAIYRAAAKAFWGKVPDEGARGRLCKVYTKLDEKSMVLTVGRQHNCYVDTNRVAEFKGGDWFIDPATGSVTTITYAEIVDDRWNFSYMKMEEVVFGGWCRHLNGDRKDNRIQNLASTW